MWAEGGRIARGEQLWNFSLAAPRLHCSVWDSPGNPAPDTRTQAGERTHPRRPWPWQGQGTTPGEPGSVSWMEQASRPQLPLLMSLVRALAGTELKRERPSGGALAALLARQPPEEDVAGCHPGSVWRAEHVGRARRALLQQTEQGRGPDCGYAGPPAGPRLDAPLPASSTTTAVL